MIPLHLATVSSSIGPGNVEPGGIAEPSLNLWLPCPKAKQLRGPFLATAWPATGFIEVVDRGVQSVQPPIARR
jgi:hypothetical protein